MKLAAKRKTLISGGGKEAMQIEFLGLSIRPERGHHGEPGRARQTGVSSAK